MFKIVIFNMGSKIINSILQPHLPGANELTLVVLNSCEIIISPHWDDVFHLKALLMKDIDPFILHVQRHGCWRLGDAKCQDISNHSVDQVFLEYSYLSTRRFDWPFICQSRIWYIDGLWQDCSISSANALEILQSCTKPSIWTRTWPSLCL